MKSIYQLNYVQLDIVPLLNCFFRKYIEYITQNQNQPTKDDTKGIERNDGKKNEKMTLKPKIRGWGEQKCIWREGERDDDKMFNEWMRVYERKNDWTKEKKTKKQKKRLWGFDEYGLKNKFWKMVVDLSVLRKQLTNPHGDSNFQTTSSFF